MEPWVSWTAFLTAAGGLAWYYTKDRRASNARRETAQPPLVAEAPSQNASRKRNKDNKASSQKAAARDQIPLASSSSADIVSETASKKKRKGAKSSPGQIQPAQSVAPKHELVEDEDTAVDDNDWAAQLVAAKQGVSLDKKSGSQKKNKPVVPIDASKDVSDMLPEPTAGPSSIRITGDETPQKKQTANSSKQEDKRTKKQRQNDRKKEEARVQREADEQQRQKLMEQQRRSAREARGEPAKNGLAPAPASNAWKATNGVPTASAVSATPLLDTFEQEATSNASDNEPVTTATTPATNASTYDHDGYAISEEAKQEIENVINPWEEVGKSKKTKKTKVTPTVSPPPEVAGPINGSAVAPATAAVNTGVVIPTAEHNGTSKAVKPQTKSKGSAANPFAVLDSAQTYFQGQPHEGDSEWTVA